jgi:hypothetical protein
MSLTAAQKSKLDSYRVIPRLDSHVTFFRELAAKGVLERHDWSGAIVLAETLRQVQAQLLKTKYPDLPVANGDLLTIDSSASPHHETWRQYIVDEQGYADFIGDDGTLAPNSFATMKMFEGRFANIGHKYDWTIFDVERAAAEGHSLPTEKARQAKRYHDSLKQWVFLFGDSKRDIKGLVTHPNINVMLAALDAATSTTRSWAGKTNAEILVDVQRLVNAVPVETIRQHFTARVYLPHAFQLICQGRFIAATATATVTLWDQILSMYAGDSTGQGKVEFLILNECDGTLRRDARTGSDTSGITGYFALALPAKNADAVFKVARPFTQLAPQQVDLKVQTLTHEKIGGAKLDYPRSIARMDFGA